MNSSKLQYCDLTSKEDAQLRLVANLLLISSDSMEVQDQKVLGEIFSAYLDRKCIVDHFFWGRFLSSTRMEQDQIEAWCSVIQSLQ